MALREDQVVRYSRQILLPRFGGQGQERLLATGARVSGGGQAVAVAAAYLAAGGTPIRVEKLSSQGFGSPAALNPDATQEPAAWGTLGTPAAAFQTSGPWVALMQGDRCLAKLATGCDDCFRLNLTTQGEPEDGVTAALLGAWGALAFQRAVLGWEARDLRLWQLDARGLEQALEPRRCERCRA